MEPQDELRFDTVSLLTDLGAGENAGMLRSVLHSMNASVHVIDLTHDIVRYDVRGASLALVRAVQYLAPGVVLVSVDAMAAERLVAVEVGGGQSILVGPDNGVLAPAVAMVGGSTDAIELTDPTYRLPAPGLGFPARDVLAPVAIALCSGTALHDVGAPIDPFSLRPGMLPLPQDEGTAVKGEVLWVDHFGALQLNLDPADVIKMGDSVLARWGNETRRLRVVDSVRELKDTEIGIITDPYGMCAVASPHAYVAELLALDVGDSLSVEPGE